MSKSQVNRRRKIKGKHVSMTNQSLTKKHVVRDLTGFQEKNSHFVPEEKRAG